MNDETCPTCGQPDNCGDCDHTPINPPDVASQMPDQAVELCEDCIDAYRNGIEPGETACECRARGEKV